MNKTEIFVVLPSDEPSEFAQKNRPCDFTIQPNQPIDLSDGDYEVGITEIDYAAVHKPSESRMARLMFNMVFIYGRESDYFLRGTNYPLPTPEELAQHVRPFYFSSLGSQIMEIQIPKSTQGIRQMIDVFNEKYPHYKGKISIKCRLNIVEFTTHPFKIDGENDKWGYIVPKYENDWEDLFFLHDRQRLFSWRYFTSPEYSERASTPHDIQLLHAEEHNALDRENPTLTPSQLSKLNAIAHGSDSAVHQGAVSLNGFVSSWIVKNAEATNYDYEYLDLNLHGPFRENGDWAINDLNNLRPKNFIMKRKDYNLTDASDAFIVYTDIIEYSNIAGQQAQVLKIIPYNSYHTQTDQLIEFHPVEYKKVNTSNIKSIRILIADTLGRFVRFSSRVRITLKFRKIPNISKQIVKNDINDDEY